VDVLIEEVMKDLDDEDDESWWWNWMFDGNE
jgi:hypothetical protein